MTDTLRLAWRWLQDEHYPHLLITKPAQALAVYVATAWLLGPWWAAALALLGPAIVSGILKAVRYPGSMAAAIGWKDLAADTWAATGGLVWCVAPWWFALGWTLVVLWVLWAGLHTWALP